mgnify:CR=1 FL=1|jgi:hypothetical protein
MNSGVVYSFGGYSVPLPCLYSILKGVNYGPLEIFGPAYQFRRIELDKERHENFETLFESCGPCITLAPLRPSWAQVLP